MAVQIAPSILAANFSCLEHEITEVEAAGVDWLHLDVMDGNFVPNISFGPLVLEACKRTTNLYLDVHLMIKDPERYLTSFAQAGASGLTIHAEATHHLHSALGKIRQLGISVGLAVNPLTHLEVIKQALPMLDVVLIMSVNPGFGGQTFIHNTYTRLEKVRSWRDQYSPSCLIEVDGGITPNNAASVASAGADILVAGSAVFNRSTNATENLGRFHEALKQAGTDLIP